MGCGGSSPVEDSAGMDPLAALMQQIAKERKNLYAKIPEAQAAAAFLRYVQSAIYKERAVLNFLGFQLNHENAESKELEWHIAHQDSIDIYEAAKGFGTDEKKMATVIIGRLPQSIRVTEAIYVKKYNRTLENVVRGENLSLLGLITGGLSDFGKFLWYRIMPKPKLLALCIHKTMKGIGCAQRDLIEILTVHRNRDLKEAADYYIKEFKEDMIARIRDETDGMLKRNYGKWMKCLSEFNRDETIFIPPTTTLDQWAKELYEAGAGKTFGCDEDVFLRILCNANEPTIEAIKLAYSSFTGAKTGKPRSLVEDVDSKMDGDLQYAVQARLYPRYEFLAIRLHEACKGIGTDEDDICRILGCNDNEQFMLLLKTYNAKYAAAQAPYNDFGALMESELSGDFLDAIKILMTQQPPKGHWIADEMYRPAATVYGKEFEVQVMQSFNQASASGLGSTHLTGPLEFVNLQYQPFFPGANFNLPPASPIWQPQIDQNYLFNATPTSVPEAETLHLKLKAEVANFSQVAQSSTAMANGLLPVYYQTSALVRASDVHASQLMRDNDRMIEFCCQRDAGVIYDACKGFGTDENTLVHVICGLSKPLLRRVNEIFKQRYGMTLKQQLDEEVSGFFGDAKDFKYFMNCLLTEPSELDAELLELSMKGLGTDERLLAELICTRSNAELAAAKIFFHKKHGKSVEDWVQGDTSGLHERFLLKCLQANRKEGQVDDNLANKQAKDLSEAGLNGRIIGGNEDLVVDILATASSEQIVLIDKHYKNLFGKSLYDAIKDSMGGSVEDAMLIRSMNKYDYFAMALYKAWDGLGTDEAATSRILGRFTKAEVRKIEMAFENQYKKTVKSCLENEIEGKYKQAVLTYLYSEKIGYVPPEPISYIDMNGDLGYNRTNIPQFPALMNR